MVMAVADYAQAAGNGQGGGGVVACDHDDAYARLQAFAHGCGGFFAGRVDQADQADEGEFCLHGVCMGVVWRGGVLGLLWLWCRRRLRYLRPCAAGKSQHPHALGGKLFGLRQYGLHIQRLRAGGRPAVNATGQKAFGRAFGQGLYAAGPDAVKGAHALAVGVKRQLVYARVVGLKRGFDEIEPGGYGSQRGFGWVALPDDAVFVVGDVGGCGIVAQGGGT